MATKSATRALIFLLPIAAAGATGAAVWARRRRERAPPESNALTDVGFMWAMHAALRRDMSRIEAAASSPDAQGQVPADVRAAWTRFRHALERHHSAEDEDLWPVLRRHLVMSEEQQVIDHMVGEHEALSSAIAAVDAALTEGVDVDGAVGELGRTLRQHLDHEEGSALPLLELHLSRDEWRRFLHTERRRTPVRERPEFLSWVLADADETDAAAVLAEIPPAGRVVYRHVLAPRYAARHRWPAGGGASPAGDRGSCRPIPPEPGWMPGPRRGSGTSTRPPADVRARRCSPRTRATCTPRPNTAATSPRSRPSRWSAPGEPRWPE